jgi:hypothetical protein
MRLTSRFRRGSIPQEGYDSRTVLFKEHLSLHQRIEQLLRRNRAASVAVQFGNHASLVGDEFFDARDVGVRNCKLQASSLRRSATSAGSHASLDLFQS